MMELPPTPKELSRENMIRVSLPPFTTLNTMGFDICDTPYPKPEEIELDHEQIEMCKTWITLFCVKRKSKNTVCSSYYLKHCVEKFARIIDKEPTYIGNGSFIAAMIICGYNVWMVEHGSRNAYFNAKYLQLSFGN